MTVAASAMAEWKTVARGSYLDAKRRPSVNLPNMISIIARQGIVQ
jgi:hypothetical protein